MPPGLWTIFFEVWTLNYGRHASQGVNNRSKWYSSLEGFSLAQTGKERAHEPDHNVVNA